VFAEFSQDLEEKYQVDFWQRAKIPRAYGQRNHGPQRLADYFSIFFFSSEVLKVSGESSLMDKTLEKKALG
jgi:hypothetical protein